MNKVAQFGGDPEKDGDEMSAFTQKHGSSKDMELVDAMSNNTIRAALSLWTAGANYADIAAQFNFRTPALAQMAIERALAESVDDTTDRTKLRRRMSLTLDRLLRSVMPKAINPDNEEQLPAVRVALTIVERYSRLNGLDAPTQIEINGPDSEQFQMFVQAAARGMGLDIPEEADIFSDEYVYAEVVDDDGTERDQLSEDTEG